MEKKDSDIEGEPSPYDPKHPYWKEKILQLYKDSGLPIPSDLEAPVIEETVQFPSRPSLVISQFDNSVKERLPTQPLLRLEPVVRGKRDIELRILTTSLLTNRQIEIGSRLYAGILKDIQQINLSGGAEKEASGRPALVIDLVEIPELVENRRKAVDDLEDKIRGLNQVLRQQNMGVEIIDVRKMNELWPQFILVPLKSELDSLG